MKNILNWTVSSFFRTIGRILAYIGIGFIIFLLVSKFDTKGLIIPRLYAMSNYNYSVEYDYNSDFVKENYTNDFFGENGYLEDLRISIQTMIDNNIANPPVVVPGLTFNYDFSYFIGFTKDDIYVILAQNYNSEFYLNIGSSNVGSIDYKYLISFYQKHKSGLPITSTSRGYWKLSDYPNYGAFRNAILDDRGDTGISEEHPVNILSGYQSSSYDYNYNYFDLDINDYFIPYFSNRKILNNCVSDYCSNNHYRYEKPVINGIDSYVPSYYNLYGYWSPNNTSPLVMKEMFKTSFSVDDISHLDNWALTYNYFYSGDDPSIDHIDYYGLVNDNGLYHYEKLTNLVNLSYVYEDCNNGYCEYEISSGSFTYGNVSNYSSIYFDIIYSDPVLVIPNSFNYYTNKDYISSVVINDICDSCLYLSSESSSRTTYTFSNSDTSQYTLLFYQYLPSNNTSGKDTYNLPSFIDFSTGTLYDDVDTWVYNSYYGKFYRVLDQKYTIGNNIGFIMNYFPAKENSQENYYKLMYFITPNLYWSDSIYSDDRNFVYYDYTNDNGEHISGSATGDFTNPFTDLNIDQKFNFIKSFLSDDMYGLSGVINIPLNKIKTLTNYTCSPISIPIPFTESNISIPCFSSIYNTYIPDIVNIWHIVLYGIVGYYIAVGIFRDIKNTIEADKNDIEVIEL